MNMNCSSGKTQKPLRVRSLRETDKGRWQALFQAYIAFYQARVSREVIENTWLRLLNEEQGMFAFIAEMPSRSVEHGYDVVGIVHAVTHPTTWATTHYCYLEDLYVDPQARGAGVGQALIKAVYDEADFRECARTYWVTKHDNDAAQKLYEKVAKQSPFIQYRRD